MENNELNNIVLKNVRNKIVISNLEKEDAMRISKRKQIVSLCVTAIILLSGSFFTVNAATDGKLAENIIEKYKEIIMIDYDQSKFQLVDIEEGKDPTSGGNTVSYKLTSTDNLEEVETVINMDNLEEENIKVKHNIDAEGNLEMIFEEK